MAPDEPDLPSRFGPFRIIRPIGRGSSSVVYAVRHRATGSDHALKVPRSSSARRLWREGSLQARIRAPHVVPVQAMLDLGGRPALLMPLIRGCSLRELLTHHDLPEVSAAAIFVGMLNGVAEMHAAGVVHRDLKPSNILLEIEGQEVVPRIADFGVARASSVRSWSRGSFVGTRAYAAPEQIRESSAADQQADLWSLGIILHELLLGHRPPEGRRPGATVPRRWQWIVERLLAVAPASRGSAAWFRSRLRPLPSRVRGGATFDAVRAHFAVIDEPTEDGRDGGDPDPTDSTDRRPPLTPEPAASPPRRPRTRSPGGSRAGT